MTEIQENAQLITGLGVIWYDTFFSPIVLTYTSVWHSKQPVPIGYLTSFLYFSDRFQANLPLLLDLRKFCPIPTITQTVYYAGLF